MTLSFFEKLTELVACLVCLAWRLASPPPIRAVVAVAPRHRIVFVLYRMYHASRVVRCAVLASGTRRSFVRSLRNIPATSIVLGVTCVMCAFIIIVIMP